ncbi:MAG TPA: hypothetical protein VF519_01935 [Mycobacteriales bacterium]|jgi:hypothetical protein
MPVSSRRAAVTAVATAAALLASALPAHATDTIDREYTGTVDAGDVCAESRNSSGWGYPLGVSFDPLSTGALSRIVLPLTPYLAGAPAVTIEVHENSGNNPGEYVIAQATVPAATVLAGPAGPTGTGHLVDVAFAQHPVLRRGDRYFVVVRVADDPAGTSRYCIPRTTSSLAQVHVTGFDNWNVTGWGTPPSDPGHVLVLADHLTTAATTLTVSSWVNPAPLSSPVVRYRAGLTAGGIAVPGELVTFTAGGRTLCTVATDGNGVAECDGLAGRPEPDGFDVTFAGTALLLPSTGHGSLVG